MVHRSTSKSPDYLAGLNPEQRAAATCGIGAGGEGDAPADGPLLVIAGAGSGKTNTLAHRVAHLVVNGADPGRILLLTFTRRAAAEMAQRVARITAAALGGGPRAGAGIGWSGTFHAIGARLLHDYARDRTRRLFHHPRS
jgi:DNA helicase-2/ATP-dependent DNA helicase PcrA